MKKANNLQMILIANKGVLVMTTAGFRTKKSLRKLQKWLLRLLVLAKIEVKRKAGKKM